jgi:uncharacterized protein with PIN domain
MTDHEPCPECNATLIDMPRPYPSRTGTGWRVCVVCPDCQEIVRVGRALYPTYLLAEIARDSGRLA